MKTCKVCNISKELNDFPKHNMMTDGRLNQCKRCRSAYLLGYRAAHLETAREYHKVWRAANVDRKVEMDANWRTRNRDRCRSNARSWKNKNPEANAEYLTVRRLRVNMAGPRPTKEEWKNVVAFYGVRCLCCGSQEDGTLNKKLVADHVVPLCLGGINHISNLQPLCYQCNRKKQNRVIDYRGV